MKTKFPTLTICVLLLICGSPLYGQQANSGSRKMPPQCLKQPIPTHGVLSSICQMLPRTTGSKKASNDLAPNRDRGTYITFDAPGAGTGPYEGTYAYVVNDLGVVVGGYFDSNFGLHGFVRAPNGTIRAIDF